MTRIPVVAVCVFEGESLPITKQLKEKLAMSLFMFTLDQDMSELRALFVSIKSRDSQEAQMFTSDPSLETTAKWIFQFMIANNLTMDFISFSKQDHDVLVVKFQRHSVHLTFDLHNAKGNLHRVIESLVRDAKRELESNIDGL